ncbi:MAG: alpha/beta hydrolase [Pseudomonadales bacterium]|nr:alpha/beta hydrolase [Pseudomonadales bacterium]
MRAFDLWEVRIMTQEMPETLHQGTPFEFEIQGLKICGKRWGNPDGAPTIGLHGWLDNANTFDRLAPQLMELNFYALDFAGHGLSDHRPEGVHYHSIYDMQDVLGLANALNWHQFNVIGHSMGGGIASELAAMFPERVRSAVHIDGFLATGGSTPKDRIEQTRLAIEKILLPHHQARVFESLEAMARRVTEATDQSMEAASVLVERGHQTVDGGVTWRTDPRIRYPTPLRHGREHIDLLLRDSTSPALLIVAKNGDRWYQGEISNAQEHHPNLTVEYIEGTHHIHLEPAYVDEVARLIRNFLNL